MEFDLEKARQAIYMSPTERAMADARHFISCVMCTVLKHQFPHDEPIEAKTFAEMVLNENQDIKEYVTDTSALPEVCVQAVKLIFSDHEVVESSTDQGQAFIVKQEFQTISN